VGLGRAVDIPGFTARPQGGGTKPVDDRSVFTAIVFVLTSGCQWRLLPPSSGVTEPTAHRRFIDWTKAGLWRRTHRAVLDELGSQGLIDWSRAVFGRSVRPGDKGGTMTGRIPVDRGKAARRSTPWPTGTASRCRLVNWRGLPARAPW